MVAILSVIRFDLAREVDRIVKSALPCSKAMEDSEEGMVTLRSIYSLKLEKLN